MTTLVLCPGKIRFRRAAGPRLNPYMNFPTPLPDPSGTHRSSTARRLVLLLVCLALGITIGYIGHSITAQSAWFLAVPACIALGWLFVAHPDECIAPQCPPRHDDASEP